MTDDGKKVQASSGQDADTEVAEELDPASSGRPDMEANRGQSGGGAYPSPHNDPEKSNAENSFMGHGGQSDMTGMGDGDEGPDEDD